MADDILGVRVSPELNTGGTLMTPGGAGAAGSSNGFSTAAPYMMALGAVQSAVGSYYAAQNAKYQLQMQGMNQDFQLRMTGINQGFQLGMSSIQARSAASNLDLQSKMAEINARQAEESAQYYMWAGEQQIGQLTLRAGKIKSAQRASQAARGIVAGVGSAAEEIATTDLMKETDAITININAVRASNAARTQKVNFENQSMLASVGAKAARSMGQYYSESANISRNFYASSANNVSSYYGSMSDAVNPWMSAAISLTGSAASFANTVYRDQKFADYIAAIQQTRT